MAGYLRESGGQPVDSQRLFNHLKRTHADMSLGSYQDTIRQLAAEGKIKLVRHTTSIRDIDKPEFAMLSSDRKYLYAVAAVPGQESLEPATPTPKPLSENEKTKVARDLTQCVRDFQPDGRELNIRFDDLWNRIRQDHPDLSIGQFHDAMRHAAEQNLLRPEYWGQNMSEIPNPELIYFHSAHMMFYAGLGEEGRKQA